MVRRAFRNGDIYQGVYEGWYCPNEGFRNISDLIEDANGFHCPNHPDVPLQWLSERNWFFRLSAYQERLERYYAEHPDWVQPEYRKNEMLGFIRQGLEDISISRETFSWGIPFPIRADGSDAVLSDGSPDPAAGVIYVWFDALINYITGAGFPDDPQAFAEWWPADLHVIGKDINRFHTIIWPAMLMSAGIELPRRVWVHGFLLAPGGERKSKSRGNMLDPVDAVNALGADGARFVTLREVPFDRDTDVSWDSFVRRYNADLANDYGNLLNRTAVDDRPLPGRRATRPGPGTALARAWVGVFQRYGEHLEACLLHEALADLVGVRRAAGNRYVDAQQPWALASAAKAGDEAAATQLRHVLSELLEANRVIALTVAPFMPLPEDGAWAARPGISLRSRRKRWATARRARCVGEAAAGREDRRACALVPAPRRGDRAAGLSAGRVTRAAPHACPHHRRTARLARPTVDPPRGHVDQ